MPITAFAKEETVAFTDMVQGFEDGTSFSGRTVIKSPNPIEAERSNDTFWVPQAYNLSSLNTSKNCVLSAGDYQSGVQLTVPVRVDQERAVAFYLTAKSVRDSMQEGGLMHSAFMRLASDVNFFMLDLISSYVSNIVYFEHFIGTDPDAPTAFEAVAECDTLLSALGVPPEDRYMALTSKAYNAMAQDLAIAPRNLSAKKSLDAYEKAYVGNVAGFDTFKLDYYKRLPAHSADTTATMNTNPSSGNTRYDPRATEPRSAGSPYVHNVDNRFQNVTVSDNSDFEVGDFISVEDVEAVHHITKITTGDDKQFRVMDKTGSTTLTITPPMIGDPSISDGAKQYQNCELTSAGATKEVTIENYKAASTQPAAINVAWHKECFEMVSAGYGDVTDMGAKGLRATTNNGFEITIFKDFDIDSLMVKLRANVRYGGVVKNAEKGVVLAFDKT